MAHCNNLAGIFDSDEDEEAGATYPQNIIELCGYLCNIVCLIYLNKLNTL